MKETINCSIGEVAFTLDRDAYAALDTYLRAIESRLPEDDRDTIRDIERRSAELLTAELHSPMHVVTIAMIERVKQRIGAPEYFGEEQRPFSEQEPQRKTLHRPTYDRALAGVCSGIAQHFDLDVTLVRLVTLLLIFFGGISIWVYIVLWIVIPEDRERSRKEKQKMNRQK